MEPDPDKPEFAVVWLLRPAEKNKNWRVRIGHLFFHPKPHIQGADAAALFKDQ